MPSSFPPHNVPAEVSRHYRGSALFADPVHAYVPYTVPLDLHGGAREVAEKDIIDTPWVQRLRYINQLQSARWVYPGAEHSRFQHSLGAMHVAGRFAKQLYPSLRAVEPSCPSLPYVEEVLRMAALLHDVGHGPFGHFFDDNHLAQFGIGHEALGQQIILRELADTLSGLRRGPSGPFADDEALQPEHVAFVMQKKDAGTADAPRWLRYLKPVLGGIYTADNLDYVLRDSYMCGVAIGPIDLERLLYYSVITPDGPALHKSGVSALTMFLNARLYLYANVYFHRTVRAIDLHLRDVFPATLRHLFPDNPLDDLRRYVRLTDWSVLEAARGWVDDPSPDKRALGREWNRILGRKLKWKMAYDATLPMRGRERRTAPSLAPEHLVEQVRNALPPGSEALEFRLDTAVQDPRNLNPLALGEWPISIYDPATGEAHRELLEDILAPIPTEMVHYRLYTTDPDAAPVLARACESVLELERADHTPQTAGI